MDWRTVVESRVRGTVQRDVPLAPRVSVRVGGPAALFVRPADVEDLVILLATAREIEQPVWALGGGANTIVGDGGYPHIVMKLPATGQEIVEDRGDSVLLDLPAGATSARLPALAKEHGLLGAEWAAGIPGTLGGMTAMNAGTRVGEMKDNLVEVLLCSADGAEWRPASDLNFSYRHSELGGRLVARVRCRLRKGSPSEVETSQAAMDTDRTCRKRTQPLQLPNSGSVFRNPPGNHAGKLIESVGLKGASEGGAQISDQHANFIVNRGSATARDVTTLKARAQQTVWEREHILLAPEVRLVGRFIPSAEILGLVLDP